MDAVPVPGEVLAVPERVIVAPAVGVFRPLGDTDVDLTDAARMPGGTVISAGQAIGVVEGPGSSTPVRSPFGGFLIGMLARTGERVREGQPVAWLRLA
jgi:multidrug efflux pump subunit AcrA (membrane-fusion protein)